MSLCNDCDAVYINGVLCHEHGCPTARRQKREEIIAFFSEDHEEEEEDET